MHHVVSCSGSPTDLGAYVPRAVTELCRTLVRAGHEAFVVGGAVRDLLRGCPAADFDVATSALPPEVLGLFPRAIPTGLQHGTVTVLLGGGRSVEVTTYRVDGPHSDGRHPDQVTFVRSLEEDLARRDFTVNALALDPLTGEVRDPFGGRADLEARLLRAVGRAEDRFDEDQLRILRAVRFATVLEFALEPATLAAIPRSVTRLGGVSCERVRDELGKLLLARRPSDGLRLLLQTGALAVVLPELLPLVGQAQNHWHRHDVWDHTLAVVDAIAPRPTLRWSALLHDVGKPATAAPRPGAPGEFSFHRHEEESARLADAILRRLKLSNDEREQIVHRVANHLFIALHDDPPVTDTAIRRFLRRVGLPAFPDLLELGRADLLGSGRAPQQVEAQIEGFRRRVDGLLAQPLVTKLSDLALDGGDVMRILGWPPGRAVGDALRRLEALVVDDPSLNTRETLEALLRAGEGSGSKTAG